MLVELTRGLEEPALTAMLVLLVGVLAAVAVVSTRLVARLGVPILLLFLGLGMLAGSDGPGGIAFEDYGLAMRLGTIALILILFDGGLNTVAGDVRRVLLPASILASLGVLLTTGLVGGLAFFLGFSPLEALLLGALVSSTDAAAVFSVLRSSRLSLKPRVGQLIEVESCVNDPMAVILTLVLISAIQSGAPPGLSLLLEVPLQLGVGVAVGLAVGWLSRELLLRLPLTATGLYPVLTLSAALIAFGAATLLLGSGVLAVFVTGLVVGNAGLPHHHGLVRVHDTLAWLAQICMFILLGLLVFPSRLPAVALPAVCLALFLALLARPISVLFCLLPLGYSIRESLFVGWVGLRGAVPIILATFPVLAGVPGAERLFDVVFFIVVLSCFVPGSTLPTVTRLLQQVQPTPAVPAAVLEMHANRSVTGQLLSFYVEPSLAVCGASLSQLEFPEGSAVALIVRREEVVAARGGTILQPGDLVYVFVLPADRALVQLLFGRAVGEG